MVPSNTFWVMGSLLSGMLIACGADPKVDNLLPSATEFSDTELLAQGCDLDRAATAYAATTATTGTDADGIGNAPIPCFHETGFGSAENTVAIADDGSVLVAPVFTDHGNGVLRTRDHGVTWDTLIPNELGGATHARVQPYMFRDPETDRIVFVTSKATGITGTPGFDRSITDDSGDSWTAGTLGEGTLDWIKIASGNPVSSTTVDYPNVMYASSPAPISTPSPLMGSEQPEFQQVMRSLDGGETWTQVGGEQLSLKPVDHGCAANEWVIYGASVVAPDGSLYISLRRCTRFGIAISRDEGDTWNVIDIPNANLVAYEGILSHLRLSNLMVTEPLAVDSAGNLYALWPDANDELRYAVSKDRGTTWSSPLAVAAPGANKVVFSAIDTRRPGVIAIAYYGSEDGVAYHGYIGESYNALDATPTFWSTTVNDPSAPLFSDGFDMGYSNVLSGGDLIEIVQVRYAPNGDLWAAFVRDMCPGLGSSGACVWDLSQHTDSPYQGVIGRLVHR